ncbi:MAG: hypothetical protein KC483_08360 [Nitrosarchaeum sp.]|nr:hypothetical protein [Nitrosarchaeum sp.]MCA9819313.1 hypothetical protein [Nitrosarchaeum sp.]
MDEILLKKIEQKLEEIASNKSELQQIAKSMPCVTDTKSFFYGIVVGRLYNSFYYQSKRILERNYTDYEFQEFLEFLKSKEIFIENLW